MEREFESKGLITKSQFKTLISQLEILETRIQTNTYLDTANGFFKSKASALRLRIINDQYIFSLKQQDSDGATEWNQPLTGLQYQQIINHKSIDLSNFECPYQEHLTNLNIVTITTTRYVCQYQNQVIELDQTNFGATVDYELEIEADNLEVAKEMMDELARDYHLTIKKSYPKIARYYMYN